MQSAEILVWQNDVLIGRGPSVTVLDQAVSQPSDLVGSSRLTPVLADTETHLGSLRLAVASNTGFDVAVGDPLIAAQLQARILRIGANAGASPHASEAGMPVIFSQSEKTASRPGAPQTQAIEIEISWTERAPESLRIIARTP
ncbi:MAG: hypothetical protein AAFR82_07935 [Pseudomonadota bacterium]